MGWLRESSHADLRRAISQTRERNSADTRVTPALHWATTTHHTVHDSTQQWTRLIVCRHSRVRASSKAQHITRDIIHSFILVSHTRTHGRGTRCATRNSTHWLCEAVTSQNVRVSRFAPFLLCSPLRSGCLVPLRYHARVFTYSSSVPGRFRVCSAGHDLVLLALRRVSSREAAGLTVLLTSRRIW